MERVLSIARYSKSIIFNMGGKCQQYQYEKSTYHTCFLLHSFFKIGDSKKMVKREMTNQR